MTGRVATGAGWELREGRWQDVLNDITDENPCDVLLGDWPFSERTHSGQRTGSSVSESTVRYDSVTEADVIEVVSGWAGRVSWWMLAFSDHVAQRWWEESFRFQTWYPFAPVPCRRYNPAPRMTGDGPASSVDWLNVARPRHKLPKDRVGSRPGDYAAQEPPAAGHPGAKSLDLMRAIIRDYTRPGDLIVDPCAGGGTTLLAAAIEGRRAIGAEMDPATFDIAAKRLSKGYTPTFDFGGAA